jgi:hypothetical protein
MKPILFKHLQSGQTLSLWFVGIGVTAEEVDDFLLFREKGPIL